MRDLLQSFLEFWVDVILLVPRIIFYGALQFLEFAIDFLSSTLSIPASALGASLPPDLLYFLTMFQVHVGLPWVAGALLGRFVIRRIPFIG